MRRHFKLIIFVLILFLSIGFAYLTANLDVTGTIAFRDNVWDVHLDNIVVEEYSVDADNPTINTDKDTVNFSISLTRPGDYYEFYVDVVNSGTMDATLDSTVKSTLTGDYLTNLNYNVTYYSDREISQGDLLRAGCKERIKVRVEYKYDVDSYIKLDNINLFFKVNYIKTDTHVSTYNANVWNFEFKAEEDTFVVPKTGTYKLEVWGASGGGNDGYRGYGGYSTGLISLTKDNQYYIYVGGEGTTTIDNLALTKSIIFGGWNGGGSGYITIEFSDYGTGSGGGSTDIRTVRADVTYQNYSFYTNDLPSLNSRIIVAGGGGGQGHGLITNSPSGGANGGGYIGNAVTSSWNDSHLHPLGGTQSSTTFGYGASPVMSYTSVHLDAGNRSSYCSGGAGGGYYGGSASIYQGCRNFGGAGGSGYIGNTNLTDKIMYCYDCQSSENEADETHIKTRSTTNVSETPTSNYAKIGHGYARITYVG